MLALTLGCQWRPEWFVRGFTSDPKVIAVGAQYLHIISWNFVASGLIFTCSGMFQALGNTVPAVISTATRLVTFVIPAIWLSRQPHFRIEHVWYLSVATMTVQAMTSLWLVRMQFRKRLQFGTAGAAAAGVPIVES
jgi:Na+-driven multidrug efflux pump